MPSLWLLTYRFLLIPLLWIASILGAIFNKKMRMRLAELHQFPAVSPCASKPRIWIHAASMGEFEQVITIAELLHPEWSIVASFTSPSGLAHGRRMSHLLDASFLLPLDSLRSMRRLVDAVSPTVVLYSRYDVWPVMLSVLSQQGVKSILVNATAPSRLYAPLRGFYQWMYSSLSKVYAVDDVSASTLRWLTSKPVDVLNDTRYDRILGVTTRAESQESSSLTTVVFGSVWEQDIEILRGAIEDGLPLGLRLVLVPHEPSPSIVQRIGTVLPVRRSSELDSIVGSSDHIVVDTVGQLLRLYGLSHAAYVGGGFGFNVHSVAEPAAFAIPVACGPNVDRSVDAKALRATGGLEVITTSNDLRTWLSDVVLNAERRTTLGAANRQWIIDRAGSSQVVAEQIRGLID